MGLIKGGSGTGDGLSAAQRQTLDHIAYNPDSESVETDVPLQTTLNSLFLARQFGITSGGERLVIRNLTTHTDSVPLTQDFLDHSLDENHGSLGVREGDLYDWQEKTPRFLIFYESSPSCLRLINIQRRNLQRE